MQEQRQRQLRRARLLGERQGSALVEDGVDPRCRHGWEAKIEPGKQPVVITPNVRWATICVVPRSITAEPSPEDVAHWCRLHLGVEVIEEVFRTGYLSVVVGVRTSEGDEFVVKARPPAERLAACYEVQRHLAASGFPCPEPLVPPTPLGELTATAEALVPGGEAMPTNGRDAASFAAPLAELVRLAPLPTELPTLAPSPPWTAWEHREPALWPWPDDRDVDLNAVDGPAWIDGAASAARQRLWRSRRPAVVGHGDWYTGNLRWKGDKLLAAFDWDSVIAQPEPAIVGLAAAVFPATHAGTEAMINEPVPPEPIDGNIPGFLHIVLRRDLEVTPPPKHEERVARFARIKMKEEARQYVREVLAKLPRLIQAGNRNLLR